MKGTTLLDKYITHNMKFDQINEWVGPAGCSLALSSIRHVDHACTGGGRLRSC